MGELGVNNPINSLAGRLILGVGLVAACFGAVFCLLLYNHEKSVMLGNLRAEARFASDITGHALRRDMLGGLRNEISATLSELVNAREVRAIDVIAPSGRVTFSSSAGRVGTTEAVTAPMDSATGPAADSDGAPVVRYFMPIANEPQCFTAACHQHPQALPVLGVLRLTVSAERLTAGTRRLALGVAAYGVVLSLIVFGAIYLVLRRFVTKPMAALGRGMQELASGELIHPIGIQSRDEMGRLASAFNSMASDIRAYRVKLETWNEQLQAEVDRKTSEIALAHDQMLGAEKLASLGRMAAGVAHELNNPLTGVLTFAHLLKARTPADRPEDHEDLDAIITQTERCARIIRDLLGFARMAPAERAAVSLNKLIAASVTILRNQSKFREVMIATSYAEGLPRVFADSNQIQQVILNIIQNAVDAMDNRGELNITTRVARDASGADFVEAEFTDNGPGIADENLGRIFEPFFTTKPVGKGTGLGLPVSYGIIKRHGGDITVRSTTGKGTTFRVLLPVEGATGATGATGTSS